MASSENVTAAVDLNLTEEKENAIKEENVEERSFFAGGISSNVTELISTPRLLHTRTRSTRSESSFQHKEVNDVPSSTLKIISKEQQLRKARRQKRIRDAIDNESNTEAIVDATLNAVMAAQAKESSVFSVRKSATEDDRVEESITSADCSAQQKQIRRRRSVQRKNSAQNCKLMLY